MRTGFRVELLTVNQEPRFEFRCRLARATIRLDGLAINLGR